MTDFQILPRLRRGRLLTPARFGCLEGMPTLNITNGCLFQCTYCYARGYSQAPKKREVHLYVNLPDLLERELPRKRALPPWVILNTSSDCFQPHLDILEMTYRVVDILLRHRIGISFLTKGRIPQRFYRLLGQFSEKVLAQIGLVSLSEKYWRVYEPYTPSPEDRIENIRRLKEIGILPEIRIDPIIPFITDREDEMAPLFERLGDLGVRRVTLSYLHLRPAIEGQLGKELPPPHTKIMQSCFKTRDWKVVGSSSWAKLVPIQIRERGYGRIVRLAEKFGLTPLICQCKNPDLKGDLCSAGRMRRLLQGDDPPKLPLFRC